MSRNKTFQELVEGKVRAIRTVPCPTCKSRAERIEYTSHDEPDTITCSKCGTYQITPDRPTKYSPQLCPKCGTPQEPPL